MIFGNPATVKITAPIADSSSAQKIAFDGITSDSQITPEEAETQINKIFSIVDKSVSSYGMTRTAVQEATDNG